jgi:hypothetical protein
MLRGCEESRFVILSVAKDLGGGAVRELFDRRTIPPPRCFATLSMTM